MAAWAWAREGSVQSVYLGPVSEKLLEFFLVPAPSDIHLTLFVLTMKLLSVMFPMLISSDVY